VNAIVLVAVPLGVVTAIGPDVAPAGTVAVTCVAEFTENVAAVPLKVTAVAPVNPVPVIVTDVPAAPLVGENDVIVGAPPAVTVKLVTLVAVPSASVTAIGPVVEPAAIVAVTCVSEFTVNDAAAVPLNVTAVTALASMNAVPVIVTEVPTGPLVGVNEVTVGAAAFAAATPRTGTIAPARAKVMIPLTAPWRRCRMGISSLRCSWHGEACHRMGCTIATRTRVGQTS
jgi:hypothetical protein